MKVGECTTRTVRIADPDDSIRAAARMMAELDAGAVPAGENDHLVGMITDRDIAIRAVAEDKDPNTRTREVMTAEIRYCFEDQDIEHALDSMGDNRVRRRPESFPSAIYRCRWTVRISGGSSARCPSPAAHTPRPRIKH